jgi:hypothetical protein
VVASMKSATLSGGSPARQASGHNMPYLGSQLSFHGSVSSPVPIRRTSPCFSTCTPSWIARQTWDAEDLTPTRNRLVSEKLTSFKTFALNESGLCIMRHPCLARRAKLNNSKSLKPKPPIYFGLHISFHET